MADILPFRALRYDLQRVSAAQVVTQPYDKITPAMQERYYAASPYNLVRIILGRRESEDNTGAQRLYPGRRHSPGNGEMREFCGRTPSLRFTPTRRRSPPLREPSLSAADSSPWAVSKTMRPKVVYRHEQTLSKPKADRLDLLRATRAHYEQLFLLYEDSGEIASLLTPKPGTAPTIDVADEYGVAHRVWQISDAAVIAAVQRRCAIRNWSSPTATTATKPLSTFAMNVAPQRAQVRILKRRMNS